MIGAKRPSLCLLVSLLSILFVPGTALAFDAAFLQAVEPEVGRSLARDLEGRLYSVLEEDRSAPRLMPAQTVNERLSERGGESFAIRAEEEIEALRTRLSSGRASRALIDEVDRARETLLHSVTHRPRLDAIRDAWALRGLAVHLLGEPEAARRDFARVLESDPSYRPDPRLFPVEARNQMGRALMSRTDSHWRVLSSHDAATLGRFLNVDYVVVGHLQDMGFVELSWRVDVFDVVAGRFVGETEVSFPDTAAERSRAADEVAALLVEVVPRMSSPSSSQPVAQADPPPDSRVSPPDQIPEVEPRGTGTEPPPAGSGPGARTPRRSSAFEPAIEPDPEPGKRSATGWIVAAAIVALAAGGTATYIGLTAEEGMADLHVNIHR